MLSSIIYYYYFFEEINNEAVLIKLDIIIYIKLPSSTSIFTKLSWPPEYFAV